MSLCRCESCKGRKIIVGIGGMEKECSRCLGVGYVKVEVVAETKEEPLENVACKNNEQVGNLKRKKRRG